MKKILLLLLVAPLFGKSQSMKDSAHLKALLFNHFIDGAVLLKSGEVEKASMNYNTDNQSIVFIKNGEYMTLTGLETIDTIYIDDKKFTPVKESVYEVATTTTSPVTLFVSYTNKVRPLVATVDHNGGSKQVASEVSNTMSDTYMSRIFRGNYSVEFIRHFWVHKGSALYKITSEKQLLKHFPGKENKIVKFISDNKTDFHNSSDMVNLIDFCNDIAMK